MITKIEVIGHRGARSYAPENTIPGYMAALYQGVDYIDVDVALTKDQVFIGYHDLIINPDILIDINGTRIAPNKAQLVKSNLDLTPYLIKNLDFDFIQSNYRVLLNQKSRYAKYFPNQKQVPDLKLSSLQEIVDYVNRANSKVNFQFEIKNNFSNPSWSFEVNEVAQLMYQFIIKNDILDRVKIQAFDWRILIALNKLDSRIKTAYLYLNDEIKTMWHNLLADKEASMLVEKLGINQDSSLLPLIKELGGYSYEPEDVALTYEQVVEAHALGLKVMVWRYPEHSGSTFDTKLTRKLIIWGVDGFIADDPLRLRRAILQTGILLLKSIYKVGDYSENWVV